MAKESKDPLADAFAQINKQFGEGSIIRMGEDPDVEVKRISTGVWNLDIALGGGLPLGRMVETYGPNGSGKTTIALSTIAEAQRSGETCAFIDMEHALDPAYARALGVDVDSLLLSQPGTGEQALEIVDILVKTGQVRVIVVDSVAAMSPRAEIEGDYGDAHVGLMARLMGQALRKLTPIVHENDVCLIWINQLRQSIGVTYGPTEFTPGGKGLPFYSSVRLDVRRIETIKTKDDAKDAFANRTRVKVVKNKVGIPHKQVEFDLVYGQGIPKAGVLLDMALKHGVIKQSGAWFATDQGEQVGQGRVKSIANLTANPVLYESVRADVQKALDAA